MRRRITILLTALVLPSLACDSVENWKRELSREPTDRVVGSWAEASETLPIVMLRDGDKVRGKLYTDDNVIAIDGYRSYFDVFVFSGHENETFELKLNSYVQGLVASNDMAAFYPSLVILRPDRSVLVTRPDTVTHEVSFWRGDYFSAKLSRTLDRSGRYSVIVIADNGEHGDNVTVHVAGRAYPDGMGGYSYSPGHDVDVQFAPRGEYTIELRKRE